MIKYTLCDRCGRKTKRFWPKEYVSVRTADNVIFTDYKEFILCSECSKLAKSKIAKFMDELVNLGNPLSNGQYVLGQDFNTKDWWVYDDEQEKKLEIRFDTYMEAYDYTEKLRREAQYENTTKEKSDETN